MIFRKRLGLFCYFLWRPVTTCGCCEPTHCFTAIFKSCRETIYVLLKWNMYGLGSFRELLWIYYWLFGILRNLRLSHLHSFTWNIYGFENFRRLRESIIDGLGSPGSCPATIYTFYKEVLMFLEASGGCCGSSIDGLESPRCCGEDICILLQWNINSFVVSRKLLWIHSWWFGISKMLRRNNLHI